MERKLFVCECGDINNQFTITARLIQTLKNYHEVMK